MPEPSGRKACHLVQVTLTEQQFQRNSGVLGSALLDPNVEGVYETQVDPVTHALLDMGCVTRVGATRRAGVLAGRPGASSLKFELDELEYLSTSSHEYLSPTSSTFKYGSLLHVIIITRLFLTHTLVRFPTVCSGAYSFTTRRPTEGPCWQCL